jgi:hypothetical protein
LAPPAESVARAADTVRAAWVVVPKYVPDAKTAFETVTHARMLAHLADSSYNYNALGPAGFNALARPGGRLHLPQADLQQPGRGARAVRRTGHGTARSTST